MKHMKSFLGVLTLILVLSAVPALAALDSQYLVVVGKTAPASDVILGANFAASMKGTVAVTFSSAIDTELYASITDDELSSKTIVVINGEQRHVKILGTSNAAAAANTYFTNQGFTVEMITMPQRKDVLLNAPQPTQPPAPKPAIKPNAANTTNVTNTTPTIAKATDTQSLKIQPEQKPVQQLPPEPVPTPKQETSVFVRVWTWFTGLF